MMKGGREEETFKGGRKERGKEGRKGGRKEGGKEGRKGELTNDREVCP